MAQQLRKSAQVAFDGKHESLVVLLPSFLRLCLLY